jgi:hypothetical protein
MWDLIDRRKDEHNRLTLAITHGYAMAMVPGAFDKWRASLGAPTADAPVATEDAVRRQSASLGRLAGLFPQAVKRRPAPPLDN